MTFSGVFLLALSLLAQQKPRQPRILPDGGLVVERGGLRHDFCFSPDGNFLAAMDTRSSGVLIYDATDFRALRTLQGMSAPNPDLPEAGLRNHFIQFSPDSKLLVTGLAAEQFKTILAWETSTWTEVGMLPPPSKQLNTLGFSPSGKEILAVGSTGDGLVLLAWSTELVKGAMNPTPTRSVKLESDAKDIILDPRGSRMYLGASEQGYVVADPVSGIVLETVEDKPVKGKIWSGGSGAALSPNAKLLAVASGKGGTHGELLPNTGLLRVWDVEQKRIVLEALQPSMGRHVAFSGDGKKVAIVCEGSFSVYEVPGGRLLRKELGSFGPNLSFSGSWLFLHDSRGPTGGVSAWRIRNP